MKFIYTCLAVLVFLCTSISANTNEVDFDSSLNFDRNNRIEMGGGSTGWYFSPHVGMNMISNTSREGFTISFDSGISFGGGFGVEIRQNLAFQFDFGYIRNDIDLITNETTNATSAPDVEYTQIPLMFNLIWSPSNQPDLKPYVGLGIGAIRGKYESNAFVSSEEEWALAGRVQIGGKIDLSSTSRLSFGYQFTLANYDDRIDNHTVGIGLQFNF